jgi:subtilase family serine protease
MEKKMEKNISRAIILTLLISFITIMGINFNSKLPNYINLKMFNVQPAISFSKKIKVKVIKSPNMKISLLKANYNAQLLSPNAINQAYHLFGDNGGVGKTIAIIDADDDVTAESDLNTFSSQFGLPACTTANGCFTKYLDNSQGQVPAATSDAQSGQENQGETSLDIEWAHAIAPKAKILLVEESSASNIVFGVEYADSQPGVNIVSISFGGCEQSSYTQNDTLFTNPNITYFASSGDGGEYCSASNTPTQAVNYPSTSPYVISVGGTSLGLNYDGSVRVEKAWSGSNGGVSQYEALPSYQSAYGINRSGRTTPDVSLNADPNTGFPIYTSFPVNGTPLGWEAYGGTSAGSPIWAAIAANSGNISLSKLYQDAKNNPTDFRDITSGSNGSCGADCTASTGYDLVTGLGVPNTWKF